MNTEDTYDKFSLTDKDKMGMGFLPAAKHIISIIAANRFYAVMKDDVCEPLIAWAFIKDGSVWPLIYDKEFATCRCPEKLDTFIRIESDIEEEEFGENGDGEEGEEGEEIP